MEGNRSWHKLSESRVQVNLFLNQACQVHLERNARHLQNSQFKSMVWSSRLTMSSTT